MASKYSLVDWDSEDERLRNPSGPPLRNQVVAAIFVSSLFKSRNINYAIMGGFAMILRGSTRSTPAIDMIVETTMQQLWRIFEPEERLIVPNTKLIDGVMRIFVRTGIRDNGCTSEHNVEVDLVLCGVKGAPRSLENERELLPFTISETGEHVALHGLNLLYMLRTKLRASADRNLDRDTADMQFLVRKYGNQVKSLRDDLFDDDVEQFLENLSDPVVKEELARYLCGG